MGPQEAPVKQDAGLRLGFQPPPVKAEATDCRWQRISRRNANRAFHSAFTPGPVLCGSGYVCHLFGIPGTPKNCVRIETMATSITNCLFAPAPARPVAKVPVRALHRRRITPQAGRALDILGHAIEYLTDEFVHGNAPITADNAQLQATQMLMACNREVFYGCSEIPSFGERWHALFHRRLK